MAWINPFKNWAAGMTPNSGDFNRIEENVDILGRLDRTSNYAVATGTNAYALVLNPNPQTYYEGMCIAFKIVTANTAASTLNVNGLGARPIRKQNGQAVAAGNLKAGTIYTARYDGANFILQGEGGEGTAVAGDVLTGKTFTNDLGTFAGTMPNRGAISNIITTHNGAYTVPAGYHNGNGIVRAQMSGMSPGAILIGHSIGGQAGTLNIRRLATIDLPQFRALENEIMRWTYTIPAFSVILGTISEVRGERRFSSWEWFWELMSTFTVNYNTGNVEDFRAPDGSVDRYLDAIALSGNQVRLEWRYGVQTRYVNAKVHIFGF